MATRHPLVTMSDDEPPAALPEVLNTARAAVDQEFQISERLDSKARGLVVLAGQWFAVAQAVSAIAYSTKDAHDWMLYCVAGTAAAAAVALGFTFFFAWQVWKVRPEEAVSPGGLMQMKAVADDPGSMGSLIDHYATTLRNRRLANKRRSNALEVAERVWFAAMAFPLLQLGFALATRLFA